jgi:hypothetical protein
LGLRVLSKRAVSWRSEMRRAAACSCLTCAVGVRWGVCACPALIPEGTEAPGPCSGLAATAACHGRTALHGPDTGRCRAAQAAGGAADPLAWLGGYFGRDTRRPCADSSAVAPPRPSSARLGPARLVHVTVGGRVRSVRLDRIEAGRRADGRGRVLHGQTPLASLLGLQRTRVCARRPSGVRRRGRSRQAPPTSSSLSTGRTVRALPQRAANLAPALVAMLADDAGALLRALKIPSATVAGFSIGSGCSRLGMRSAVVSKPASTK